MLYITRTFNLSYLNIVCSIKACQDSEVNRNVQVIRRSYTPGDTTDDEQYVRDRIRIMDEEERRTYTPPILLSDADYEQHSLQKALISKVKSSQEAFAKLSGADTPGETEYKVYDFREFEDLPVTKPSDMSDKQWIQLNRYFKNRKSKKGGTFGSGTTGDGGDSNRVLRVNINSDEYTKKITREEFILAKFRDLFGKKGTQVNFKRVMELTSSSKALGKIYLEWIKEWRLVSDQPYYLKNILSPESYSRAVESSAKVNATQANFSKEMAKLAKEYAANRKKLEDTRDSTLETLYKSDEYAWLMGLDVQDLPIGVITQILDKLPPVKPTKYDDVTKEEIVKDEVELSSERKLRSERMARIVANYRVYLIDQSMRRNMDLRDVHKDMHMDLEFGLDIKQT